MVKKYSEYEFINESTDERINKLSRLLSDYFYPNAGKSTYPVRCNGFKEHSITDYEVYFSIWNEDTNDYKSGPITTILVRKTLI